MSNCTIITGSVTQAMKAKRILAEHSIAVEVTKLSAIRNQKGCIYGIAFPCGHRGNITRILGNAGIPFEEFRE